MTFTPSAATTRLLTDKFSGTGNPLVNWSAVWNNAATTFTGIQFDVTDTASAAGSLLMDLRVGGVSSFNVDKSGNAKVLAGLLGGEGPSYAFKNAFNGEALFHASYSISWASGGASLSGAASLTITRDAADTLAQRRGVNAQAFRVYNTFTDASNYERARIAWSGNILQLGTENAGTGLARSVRIVSAQEILFGVNGTGGSNWFFSTAAHFLASSDNIYDIGAAAASRPRNLFLGSYMQMSEMTAPAAPATNNVVIYAEDNGAGKTRLMARFATGAAQQIAIEP